MSDKLRAVADLAKSMALDGKDFAARGVANITFSSSEVARLEVLADFVSAIVSEKAVALLESLSHNMELIDDDGFTSSLKHQFRDRFWMNYAKLHSLLSN